MTKCSKCKKKIKIRIDIGRFLIFHKRRIRLLKKLAKEKIYGRLIFQISFLGFESLAKVLYPKKKSGNRFIELLSKAIGEKKATYLYKTWRNSLVHQGFITEPWTTLESWDDEDIGFILFDERDLDICLKSSVEYTPAAIIAIYNDLIYYFDDFFKKRKSKTRIITVEGV